MSKITRILSWNVRGLNNPVILLAVLRAIKRLDADVICLQETHFPPLSTPSFAQRQFCHQYHATYSVYAREVSLLIRRGTQFSFQEVKIDPEGRYIFLLCSLSGTKCITAGLYIPPPFSATLLTILADYTSCYLGIPILAIGDFNNYIDLEKDRVTDLGIMCKESRNPHHLAVFFRTWALQMFGECITLMLKFIPVNQP